MDELPPYLQLALEACEQVAPGEIWFHKIPKKYKERGVTRHDLAVLAELGYLTQTGDTSCSLGNARYCLTPDEERIPYPEAFARSAPQEEPPIHFPQAFDWWRERYHGRRFPFECECKIETGVLQRVTQTKRRCPNCGEPVTTEAIDHQLRRWEPERQRIMEMEKKAGVLSTLETIGVVAAAGLMYGVSLFFGKKR